MNWMAGTAEIASYFLCTGQKWYNSDILFYPDSHLKCLLKSFKKYDQVIKIENNSPQQEWSFILLF